MGTIDSSKLLRMKSLDALFRELCMSFSLLHPSEKVVIDSKSVKLLKFILDQGYIERGFVEVYVHENLLDLGEATFMEHKSERKPVDCCRLSHFALGYAIKHGHVLALDVTFDHGETAEEYIKSAEGLLEDVVEQLLNYEEASHPKTSRPIVWGPTSPLKR